MNSSTIAVLAVAVILGAARPLLIGHEPGHLMNGFTAFAHLYVGGLVGAWLAARRSLYLWLAGVLSVVEVVSAAITHS